MLRYVEIGFFLLPFALFGAWWVLGARASRRVLWGAVLVAGLLAVATVWYGLEHSLPAGSKYVPAQLSNDAAVSGGAAASVSTAVSGHGN